MNPETREQFDYESAGTTAPTSPEAAAQNEFRKNPLRALWRRRWVVLTCMIIGAIVGYAIFVTSEPVYQGTARILVSQSAPKLVQQDFQGMLAAGGNNWLKTQCELIRSPVVLHKVADNEVTRQLRMLKDHPEIAASIRSYLQNATTATPAQQSEIVTVAVRGPDAEGVAVIANQVVEEYRRFNDELKKTSASEVLRILGEKKDENERALEQAYFQKLEFQKTNATFSFNRDVKNPVLERVTQLSESLTSAELELLTTQAEYDSVKTMLDDPEKVRRLLQSPIYRGEGYAMRRELREMQQSLQALGATYGTGNTRLAAQQEKMQRTKQEIEAEEKEGAQAILADITRRQYEAQQKAERVRTWLNEEQSRVLQVNKLQADFDRMLADISRREKYNDQLAEQMKSIGLAESSGAMNVYVVESAQTSKNPVAPDRLRLLFLGAAGGLLVGAMLSLLLEYADQRLRSAEEIKAIVGLPIMGVIPHIIQARTQSTRGLIVHNEPMSDVAEAYRTIRTAVYFGTPGGSVKTLLVTSPAPGDGKTTLAANLATAMAQAGNRVILLDCDFRKPSQHRVFELEKKVGMSNVLAGEMTIEQATQPTRVAGLSVVPCGPIPANPSEILNSQSFLDLLDSLSRQYDLVLIDSPPVLPVTDARVLAASCDGVLMALRAEKTTRSAATGARDQLQSVGGRLLGLVVNDVSRRKGIYAYYYADEGRYAYYHYGPRRGGTAKNGQPPAVNGSSETAAVESADNAG